MTVVNPKSISGITSITTASGSDNLLTIHTSDASNTERFRIDSTGTTKIVTGIVTTLTATTGIVTTLTTNTLTANSTTKVGSGITLSPDGDIFTTGITTFTNDVQFIGDSGISSITYDKSANQLNFVDNTRARFGSGADLSIYHDGSDSYIKHDGTGNLYVQTSEASVEDLYLQAGNDIYLRPQTGENGIKVIGNGAVELYHDNSKTAYTHGSGFNIKGGNTSDQTELQIFGNEGQDASILLTSDDGDDNADNWRMYAQASDHSFALKNYASGAYENSIVAHGNGAVELYHDNTKQCETSANGLAFPSGKGIDFSATSGPTNGTGSSELFDDYEEGTWSPAVQQGVTNTQTFDSTARYTKIGRQVYCQFLLQFSGAGTGARVQFSGLPFTSANNTSRGGGTVLWTNIPDLNGYDFISVIVAGNATNIECYQGMDSNAVTSSGGFTNKAFYARFTYEAA